MVCAPAAKSESSAVHCLWPSCGVSAITAVIGAAPLTLTIAAAPSGTVPVAVIVTPAGYSWPVRGTLISGNPGSGCFPGGCALPQATRIPMQTMTGIILASIFMLAVLRTRSYVLLKLVVASALPQLRVGFACCGPGLL